MVTPAASRGKRPARSGCPKPKHRHGEVLEVPIEELRPCPRNDDLYRPPSDDDADFITILAGIRRKGQLVPATITKDRMIMDGHRRFFACRRLGIPTLKCIVRDKYSWDVTPADLAEYNRQRVKTSDELVREEIALADPDESYEALLEERDRRLQQYDHLENIEILGTKKRWKFSESQTKPFVDAVAKYVLERKQYWPLTDRRVHYGILDIRGLLRNYGKRKTPYENDEDSYKRLCDILVRMRLANIIPMHSIEDETRPVAVWDCYKHVGAFTSRQLDDFLANYSRDLMQSQQDHFEIVGEKMTIESIIRPIAAHFCIPYTIGRGYSSLPPRANVRSRSKR